MTRLAILADIHGNWPALQAIHAELMTDPPDHVIIAGDLVNGAPFSIEVLEFIYSQRWGIIRGNHEFYILNHRTPRQDEDLRDSPNLDWQQEILRDWLPLLAALPDELSLVYPDAPPVRVLHGIPGNNRVAMDPDTDDATISRYLAGVEEPLVICGHFHLPVDRQVGWWRIINPGSAGMVADGHRRACYVRMETVQGRWHITHHSTDYDAQPIIDRNQAWGLYEKLGPVYYLQNLQILRARPLIVEFYRWHAQYHPDIPMSLDTVDEFVESGLAWQYYTPKYQVNPQYP